MGLHGRFRDHEGDRIAHEGDFVVGESGVLRNEQRLPVGAGQGHQARREGGQTAQTGCFDVFTGENGEHAWRCRGLARIERFDTGVRVGRSEHEGPRLSGQVEVISVLPATAQESWVLTAGHGLAQGEFHAALLTDYGATNGAADPRAGASAHSSEAP